MSADDDAIAVIGVAGRLPGAADAAGYWRNLCAGRLALRRYADEELDAAGVPDALRATDGYVPVAGHLDALADFDADLFGYRPDEAARIDPQHRLFLECAWWALEDAGYDPDRTDVPVGVFAGAAPNRYLLFHQLPARAASADWEAMLEPAATPDYLPTRVSYKLGLTGPSIAVQTACSSSLVAVCQAAQSLLDVRCDVAVAGGAAVTATRPAGYVARPGGMTSPSGRCLPFDARADGTVFGNGAGAVVLKRLDDALADGDHVEAVLRGWAVGNDGADRAGFTVPGLAGQTATLAEAVAVAGLEPADIGYVQAHGTGTPLGDELELAALAAAYAGAERPDGWLVGSVKAGIGNLDAAAGVAGLIAAVCAVRDGVLPGMPTVTRPTAALPAGFGLVDRTRPWPAADPVRRAGVSSFGMGGTNAHVVVEQPPPAPERDRPPATTVLALSAADPAALAEAGRRLADHLAEHHDTWLPDVAFTLATGRRRLPYRAAVLAADVPAAASALRDLAPGTLSASTTGTAVESLTAAANAWTSGADLDVAVLHPDLPLRRVSLPGYPYQRRRHWLTPPDASAPDVGH